MKQKSWLVWNPVGHAPVWQQHANRRSATAEAERLARANPGNQFYVLETISVSQRVDVITEELTENNDLPF